MNISCILGIKKVEHLSIHRETEGRRTECLLSSLPIHTGAAVPTSALPSSVGPPLAAAAASAVAAPPLTPIRKVPTNLTTYAKPPRRPPPRQVRARTCCCRRAARGGPYSRPYWTCQRGATSPPFTSAGVGATVADAATVAVCRHPPARPSSDRDAARAAEARSAPAAAATSSQTRNEEEVLSAEREDRLRRTDGSRQATTRGRGRGRGALTPTPLHVGEGRAGAEGG